MTHALRQLVFRLQVLLLMLFSPAALFRRLNHLDWYRDTLTQWIDSLQLPPGASVLEIGCATGELSEYLAASGFRVTAIDSSDRMLSSALAASAGRVNYLPASATNLPFADNHFDAVIAASLINVIDDKLPALVEMFRACKPGGQVSFLVPSEDFDRARLEVLLARLGISDFSEACLRTWYRRARKMSPAGSDLLVSEAGASRPKIHHYLDGKVFSVSAGKSRG